MSDEDNEETPVGESNEGYLTDDTHGIIPLKGHMVFYSFRESTYGPEEVDYHDLVNKARELGLDSSFAPAPLSGPIAYKAALRTLSLPEATVNAVGWDNGKCIEKWTLERIKGSKNHTYAIWRCRQGTKNGVEDTEHTRQYRVSYVRQGEDDVLMRTWHDAYVREAWGELSEGESVPDADFINNIIRMTPWDGGAITNSESFAAKWQAANERLTAILHRTNGRSMRDMVKRRIFDMCAIPFRGAKGAVYVIPDKDGTASYLGTLDGLTDLIEWWQENTGGTVTISSRRSATATYSRRASGRTEMRRLGYIDDPRTIEYLRRDITVQLQGEMANYYDDISKAVERFDPEDARMFERTVKQLNQKKRLLQRNMQELGVEFVGGVNLNKSETRPVRNHISNRLAALHGSNEQIVSSVQELMDVDTSENSEEE
tara:strand:+ start:298 stop:1584 length:1287 start_codon:yes stop_codon:yes gene_type:complete